MAHIVDKYVNPLTDFGFKKLFGEEPNKDLLIDFLNQLLPERHQIEELDYTSNEKIGRTAADRKAIFDLNCRSKTGERFIVELQKIKQNWFKDRSVYYSSFPVQEQAQKGDWDFQLQPVYFIGILDFIFSEGRNEEDIVHFVELKDQFCNVFYDKLKLIYVELPKFTKTADELETHFEKWLYVFRHLSKLSDRPAVLQERVFTRLFEAAEIANFTPTEMEVYEEYLKAHLDNHNSFAAVKEEGRQEGREEGIEIGATQKAMGIARKLLSMQMDPAEISELTGLTIEKINNL